MRSIGFSTNGDKKGLQEVNYRYSNTDHKNIAWMKNDNSIATLLQIRLAQGTLWGLQPFELKLEYPIDVIAGENFTGKSTFQIVWIQRKFLEQKHRRFKRVLCHDSARDLVENHSS